MIDSTYVRTMAAYGSWQNGSLHDAAHGLDDAARRLDRGAFFGSIHGTLAHLLWGDRTWMSRFAGIEGPNSPDIKGSVAEHNDWGDLNLARDALDLEIRQWADNLNQKDLDGELTWFSGAAGREVSKPLALLVVHFFNHQTHHRGQVHAMLTAAGCKPDDTDLFLLPQ